MKRFQPVPRFALKEEVEEELTLRDHFAVSALQGICADCNWVFDGQPVPEGEAAELASMSYQLADAMLKERQK